MISCVGSKDKKPIDMDNLSRREIPGFINGAWFGWHSFRRGLGTRLNDMNMNAIDIQSILRSREHCDDASVLHVSEPGESQSGIEETDGDGQEKVRCKGIIELRARSSIG